MLTLVLLHEGWLQYKYCSSPEEDWTSRRVEDRDIQRKGYSHHGARRLGVEARVGKGKFMGVEWRLVAPGGTSTMTYVVSDVPGC